MTETVPGAGGGHLAEALHLAELPFQRRRDRRGHHIRGRARIERQHLNGRVIHLRQRGNRQLGVGDHAHQQNRGHQQRRGNRPQDEWARRAHGVALLLVVLFPGFVVPLGLVPLCAPCWELLEICNFRVGLQLFKTAVGHHVSRINAFHRGYGSIRHARLDIAYLRTLPF